MVIQMPKQVEQIIGSLQEHGYEAYAVGGCVRDSLLGRPPGDWDITTSAAPCQVKELFPRTIDTGILHGTVTVMAGNEGYEVTTYRIDGEYEDGRHPKAVEFTSSLLEDLKRRDFTINAMAYSHETGIVDRFGGVEDLKNGVIRCVGNPEERFTEDALRILRAVRFSAQLGFQINKETYDAIAQIAPNLKRVSKERIQIELSKILQSPNPDQIKLVYETGASCFISEPFHKIEADRSLELYKISPEKHMRWAGFLRFLTGREAVIVLRDLKMDNETIDQVRLLTDQWTVSIPTEKAAIRRIMSKISDSIYEDLLDMQEVFSLETENHMDAVRRLSREILEAGDCVRIKDLAVTGTDLIELGMSQGKLLGDMIQMLFAMVLDCPDYNKKELLLEKVKHNLNNQ